MAVTSTPVFVQTPKNTQITIVAADASTNKTVCTAGTNGTKVTALWVTSDDTSARIIQWKITRSAVTVLCGSTNVATLAGTDGVTPAVDLLGATLNPGLPIDNDGNKYLFLVSGDTLVISSTTTVTAAKTVSATAIHADF
jgi:hypothetical protein